MNGVSVPARLLSSSLLAVGCSLAAAGCLSFHQGPLPGEPPAATFRQVEGARVRYVDRGTGPAVVLVHGFASSLDTWRPVAEALVASHRVIALDLKGFGWTDRPPGDYSPAAQAALVWALLDQLGVKEAAVVAHSWGASVALAMALAAPERVRRMALYDAWVFEEQLPTTFLVARAGGLGEVLFGLFYRERTDDKMASAFFDERHATVERVDKAVEDLERPGTTAAALAAVRGQRFAEVEQRYRQVRAPVLLLWGREDRISPVAFGERLAAELPGARLLVYPRCGHFPMIEAEPRSTADLLAFLDEPPAAARAMPPPPSLPAPPPPPVEPAPAPAEPPP